MATDFKLISDPPFFSEGHSLEKAGGGSTPPCFDFSEG
jgi:hypothetical protein